MTNVSYICQLNCARGVRFSMWGNISAKIKNVLVIKGLSNNTVFVMLEIFEYSGNIKLGFVTHLEIIKIEIIIPWIGNNPTFKRFPLFMHLCRLVTILQSVAHKIHTSH